MKTKEQILAFYEDINEFHIHDVDKPMIYQVMQEFADQCVAERDAEILEWIDNHTTPTDIIPSAYVRLKQFLSTPTCAISAQVGPSIPIREILEWIERAEQRLPSLSHKKSVLTELREYLQFINNKKS